MFDPDAQELRGWLYDDLNPRAVQTLRISIDGRFNARVDAALPSIGWAGASTEASFNGFQHRIASHALSGDRLHVVEVSTTDGALIGGPFLIEAFGPLPDPQPQFRLVDRHPAVHISPERFEAPGEWVAFDPAEPLVVPAGVLTANEVSVGGHWGHRAYAPWRPYIARLTDVFVDPEQGNIFDREGRLWSGCHYLRNTAKITAARRRINQAPDGIPHVAGETMIFSESVAGNYWHWHTDCLPILNHARRRLDPDRLTLLSPHLSGWRAQGAEAVWGRRLPPSVAPLVHVEAVYASSYLDGRSIHPDAGVMETFAAIKRALVSTPVQSTPERIFVSRKDAPSRVLENEDELADALANLGFISVELTALDYAAKIALFAGARVVVGCHGAGLTNVGFCPPGATVIEIVAASRAIGAIRLLSARAGLNHHWYATDDAETLRLDVPKFIADAEARALV